MEFSDLECNICSNEYSEDHCPRLLPCSHTFCGPCISGFILAKKKECPICRRVFTANSAEDVAINRSLLNVAKQLSSTHVRSKILFSGPKKSFLESTKDFIEKSTQQSIADCQATEADAKDLIINFSKIKDVFLGANEDIEGFKKRMEGLKLSNESKITDIDQCIDLLGNNLHLMVQGEEEIKVLDAKVTSVTDFTSNGPLLDETGGIVDDVRGKITELQNLVQKNKRDRENFQKEILMMNASLVNLSRDIDPVETFAVKTFEGKQWVGRVKIESENQVSLSYLVERDLPPRSFVIELESLRQEASRTVFLDLAFGTTHLGRITIKLISDGYQALNFLHMCGGHLGASYANSQVSCVWDKGCAGERIVMGGHHQSHGGTSTKAVLSGVDWKTESQREIYAETPYKAGQVRGYISHEEASKFWIVTRDNPSWMKRNCFGMVEEGLDILKDAILHYSDLWNVKIANCGLMFSL